MIYLLLAHGHSQKCVTNAQRAEFRTLLTIAASDELPNAIDLIDDQIVGFNGTATVDSLAFTLTNFTTQMEYFELRQTAEAVDLGSDRGFNISGGRLNIDFRVEYDSKGQKGTAEGRAELKDFWYAKRLIVSDGTLQWDLHSYRPLDSSSVQFAVGFSRPNTSDSYRQSLDKAIKESGVADKMVAQLNKLMNDTVEGLMNHDHLIERLYNYTYRKGLSEQVVVPLYGSIFSKTIGEQGLELFSSTEVLDYNNTECGAVPSKMEPPAIFGGHQIFLAMNVLKSVAKYALQNGSFDTKLDRHDWSSPYFQFYVGDVRRAFGGLQQQASASEVQGECHFAKGVFQNGLVLSRESSNMLTVRIPYNCSLMTKDSKRKIVEDIGVKLELQVKPVLTRHNLDFIIEDAGVLIEDIVYGQGISLKDNSMLTFYIDSLLETLRKEKTFGSGLRTIEAFRKPGVYVSLNFLLLYDSATL